MGDSYREIHGSRQESFEKVSALTSVQSILKDIIKNFDEDTKDYSMYLRVEDIRLEKNKLGFDIATAPSNLVIHRYRAKNKSNDSLRQEDKLFVFCLKSVEPTKVKALIDFFKAAEYRLRPTFNFPEEDAPALKEGRSGILEDKDIETELNKQKRNINKPEAMLVAPLCQSSAGSVKIYMNEEYYNALKQFVGQNNTRYFNLLEGALKGWEHTL